jgi:hypothetical protein
LIDLLRIDLRIGLQHQHVLPGLGQLGLQLPDLVFVRPAVELEQRLPLLDRHVGLHQDRGDQRRLRQTGNQLHRVLHDPRLGRQRRHEAQADQEDDQQVHADEDADHRLGNAELGQLELEEDQPHQEAVAEQHQETEDHGLPSSAPWAGAVPERRV